MGGKRPYCPFDNVGFTSLCGTPYLNLSNFLSIPVQVWPQLIQDHRAHEKLERCRPASQHRGSNLGAERLTGQRRGFRLSTFHREDTQSGVGEVPGQLFPIFL